MPQDRRNGQLGGGLVKTALAIGANLQSGVAEAIGAFAGMSAPGQAPTGATNGLVISAATAASRRLAGMRTIAAGVPNRPVPQAELVQRLSEYQADASAGEAAWDRIVADVWKSEGTAAITGRHLLPGNSLRDHALSREVLPVIHVGFGTGSAEALAFDSAKLEARFGERCEPGYEEFSYEGLGATLRFYEPGFFKLMSGVLDFIDLNAAKAPDGSNFFADYLARFPPHVQRLVAHGYGRIIAFANLDIYRAIEEATTLPLDRIEPAVHGVAFAFAMINSKDLPTILRQSAIPYQPRVRAAFQNGLIYALVFLEWYVPGALERWTPQPGLEAELIDQARREARLSLERGFPLAFRLANPRA
jgi:hypothetical protein